LKHTKLILVEGIPGSGKTSTAQYIKNLFDAYEIPNRLFMEGDLDHPADYESVAYLTEEEYARIKIMYPDRIDMIDRFTSPVGSTNDRKLVYYGRLEQDLSIEKNSNVIEELRKHDIYNLSLEIYQELIIEKWLEFARNAQLSQEIVILECCFIQNPITMMFGRLNQSEIAIAEFIKTLDRIIEPLHPKLIYFYQEDVNTTIHRVIEERPNEWLQHFIWYFTQQGYGKAMGHQGLDGLCEVLQVRKQYEINIIHQLTLQKLIINNSDHDWELVLREIRDFINKDISIIEHHTYMLLV